MRSLAFLIILLFVGTAVNAQQLTNAEAIAFAEKLHHRKILNEAGKKQLLQSIDGSDIYSIVKEYGKGITKSSILRFCASAFISEKMYRIGYRQPTKKELERKQEKYRKAAEDFKNDPEAYEKWLDEQSAQEVKQLKPSRIEEKIREEDPQLNYEWVTPLFGLNVGTQSIIDKTRSVFGKTRSRTAKDLYEIGLINERVYTEIKKHLADSTISDEGEVCLLSSEKLRYYEDYPRLRDQQLQFIDSLAMTDAMSNEKATSLKSSLKDFQLYEFKEIVSNCKRSLMIQQRSNEKLTERYRRLLDTLQTIIPDLSIKELKVSIDSTPGLYGDVYNFETTFRANGRRYGSSLQIDYLPDSLGVSFQALMSEAAIDFHSGVNRWLCDQNSLFRVYVPYNTGNDIVLMSLTKQQAALWQHQDNMAYFDFEDHSNTFNSIAIEKAIADFESIGLFKHLSRAQIDSGVMNTENRKIRSHINILTSFRHVTLTFDWESGNLENPYEELTLKMAAMSRGEFTPTNVTDDFEENAFKPGAVIHYSFDFNGKHYSADLSADDDWLAPQFFELIQTALKENHAQGQFYQCIDNGQEAGYIYLNKVQRDFLAQHYQELIIE